jgi:hypothetical protein
MGAWAVLGTAPSVARADCVTFYPHQAQCGNGCTGKFYVFVVPDRVPSASNPIKVVVDWGPWRGTGWATTNRFGGKFNVELNKTQGDDVPFTICTESSQMSPRKTPAMEYYVAYQIVPLAWVRR